MDEQKLNTQEEVKEPTPEEQPNEKELEKKIQELENQLKEEKERYLYLYADFENVKRRRDQERQELLKFGAKTFIQDLLPTIDSLESASFHFPKDSETKLHEKLKQSREGLELTLKQMKDTLSKHGVQKIECLKKDFDPNFHEAMEQVESNLPEDKIVEEKLKGYTLHEHLLRPAQVSVSRGPKKNFNSKDKTTKQEE